MRLKIKDKNKKFLGQMEVSDSGVSFSADFDQKEKDIIENICRGTIPLIVERHDPADQKFVMIKRDIKVGTRLFALALRDHLRSIYIVNELHLEVDQKILEIIKKLPEGDEDRIELEKKLPLLNNLEKTFLLRELQKETKG